MYVHVHLLCRNLYLLFYFVSFPPPLFFPFFGGIYNLPYLHLLSTRITTRTFWKFFFFSVFRTMDHVMPQKAQMDPRKKKYPTRRTNPMGLLLASVGGNFLKKKLDFTHRNLKGGGPPPRGVKQPLLYSTTVQPFFPFKKKI